MSSLPKVGATTLSRGYGSLNITADVLRVFDALKNGGVAIVPGDVGYGILACSGTALEKVYKAKKRAPHKKHAMVGSYTIHKSVHDLVPREADMVKCITQDHGLPLGVIAPFKPDHPLIKNIDAETFEQSTNDGTISILCNAGPFREELAKLTAAADLPLMGSSTNQTGRGTKFRVEDIEPEIVAAADIVINYGLRKYHRYKRSSTLFDFKYMEVVRMGSCYEVLQDIMKRVLWAPTS